MVNTRATMVQWDHRFGRQEVLKHPGHNLKVGRASNGSQIFPQEWCFLLRLLRFTDLGNFYFL